jgi:hypothetical protein
MVSAIDGRRGRTLMSTNVISIKEQRVELMRKYKAANSKVAMASDAREDAIWRVIDAHLTIHDVFMDDGADDDDRDAAADAEDTALHELIDADDAYYRALDQWSPLYDKIKKLMPELLLSEITDESPAGAIH